MTEDPHERELTELEKQIKEFESSDEASPDKVKSDKVEDEYESNMTQEEYNNAKKESREKYGI